MGYQRKTPFGYIITYNKYDKTIECDTYHNIQGWVVVKDYWGYNSMNVGIKYKWAMPIYDKKNGEARICNLVEDLLRFGCPEDRLVRLLSEVNMMPDIIFVDI